MVVEVEVGVAKGGYELCVGGGGGSGGMECVAVGVVVKLG